VKNSPKVWPSTYIFLSKLMHILNRGINETHQNLPKLGFLVWKYTIWQPWVRVDIWKALFVATSHL
jgi:hypothetical protein